MKTILFFSMFTVVFVLSILFLKNDGSRLFQPNYTLNNDFSRINNEDTLTNAKANFADSEISVDVDKSPQARIVIFDKLAKK